MEPRSKSRNIQQRVKQRSEIPTIRTDHPLFESSCRLIMLNDNPHITSGFREDTTKDLKKCLSSAFTLHNDTMNVWTHGLGGLWLCSCIYEVLMKNSMGSARSLDIFTMCAFLGLTSICLYTSALYHLFRTYSVDAYIFWLIMDIQGITLQVFGSTFLSVYSEFVCFPEWQKLYIGILCLLAIITALFVPFLVRTRKTSQRTFILVCFASMGIIGWFHHFFLIGANWNQYNKHTLIALFKTYAWVCFGLVIRRAHVPERFFPGKFDVWFASHQLFHVAVVIGSYDLYLGYKAVYEWNLHACESSVF